MMIFGNSCLLIICRGHTSIEHVTCFIYFSPIDKVLILLFRMVPIVAFYFIKTIIGFRLLQKAGSKVEFIQTLLQKPNFHSYSFFVWAKIVSNKVHKT